HHDPDQGRRGTRTCPTPARRSARSVRAADSNSGDIAILTGRFRWGRFRTNDVVGQRGAWERMMAEQPDSPYLSVIVPAHNEEARLPTTLATIGAFLESRPYPAEFIVIDDGSSDATLSRALERRPYSGAY